MPTDILKTVVNFSFTVESPSILEDSYIILRETRSYSFYSVFSFGPVPRALAQWGGQAAFHFYIRDNIVIVLFDYWLVEKNE